MAKRSKVFQFDGKAAAAGEEIEGLDGVAPASSAPVFDDGPLTDEQAIALLVDLKHQRQQCERRWDDAKSEAAEAKKELDQASNAISILIDRIDRQRNGVGAAQPVLRTLTADAPA